MDVCDDFVPGFEVDRVAAIGMVFRADREEALLYDVRGYFHGEFVFVRAGTEPGRAGDFPDLARCRRWRGAAERAGDLERHVSARPARHGGCRVRARRRWGGNDWAVAQALEHGQ